MPGERASRSPNSAATRCCTRSSAGSSSSPRACRAHRPGHRVSRGGVNAGHPPPYLLRNGAITALDVPPNVPLGMFEGSQYVECPAQFRPGDRLVLVSDGLVEATDPVGEEYGEKRLQGALLATAALSTAEAVRHIIRTTRDYQHDELRDRSAACAPP